MTEPPYRRHLAMPHLFGGLFGCAGCETRCYCRPNETQCARCSIANEKKLFDPKLLTHLDSITY